MIGEVRWSLTPFYDINKQCNSFKRRPVLIIAEADGGDYVILPVSRVTNQANRDPIYDIEVDPSVYPQLNLPAKSYVRTHKQTIVHKGEITALIGNMKTTYPDLFLTVLEKREEFSADISTQALT